jgi:hypothetical protein
MTTEQVIRWWELRRLPGAPHLDLEMWVYAYDAKVYRYDAHYRMCLQRSV